MRIKIFAAILSFSMVMLLAGLVNVQLMRHDKYKVMSEENRLKIFPLMAPRGRIFDRNGNVLVKDVLRFKVSVMYNQVKDIDSLKNILNTILNIPEEKIMLGIKKSRFKPYLPTTIADDVKMEKAIQIEEVEMDYPGLLLEVYAKREYMYGKLASNVLGYLGLINRYELDKLRHYGFRFNDLVGRDGIEKYYDNYLRGAHGGKQIEVDYHGHEVRILGLKEPIPGKDVYLTIDLTLQKLCDKLLENRRGTILAMDPETGAILAMANSPAYDPDIFVNRSRKEEINDVLKNKEYPLLNRAITGEYPPGSVFKVISAVGALETGTIRQETTFECPGYFALGRARFRCWKKRGHGIQTLTEAIKNSCNVYFFNLGLRLGADGISELAEKFGFGAYTGVDLPGESSGFFPTRSWKKKRFNESWYKGDTVNYSIGQGYLVCSPLQIARMMSVFANNGFLVKPFLADKIGGVSVTTRERVNLNMSPEALRAVREGLKECVNNPRGTGMKARINDIVVAGKTGTAQTSKGRSHGWFTGFAPFVNAKLLVVVFDEYGGKGGYYAAETASKVFREAGKLGLL